MNRERIRSLILELYEAAPIIVNDEAVLLGAVWRKCGWNNSTSLEVNLALLPRPESISRRRRELYNEGLIKYSKDAESVRMEAMENEQEMAAPAKAIPWMRDD